MPISPNQADLPRYLLVEQEKIEAIGRRYGLDFFPVVFQMLSYDQMNEIAAYGGFPNRYPHWRFGMEYERLSKSYEYGLSKIYEMVINNNPSYAYLLEGNSLTDQKLVMCHVFGHVDFFKNNFTFRATDLDAGEHIADPVGRRKDGYDPNRRWVDKMANHGSAVRRIVDRYGIHKVEEFVDVCLLLENAPLERWERAILSIIRDEGYYFVPQMQTKIMNEGWASYWHSKMMTGDVCDWSEIVDYAENNAGVMATSGGRLNPYKLGVELYRNIEERWDKGQFGQEWEDCDDLDVKKNWDLRLGLGKQKVFEVRALYNDVTFIDEFLTPEFAMENKMFTFNWSNRNERYEIDTREFQAVKEKLLAQLTNFGNPTIFVEDANYENRGELLLMHEHRGVDLRNDYARETMASLVRIWKRPVSLATQLDGKRALLRYDGKEHSVRHDAP